MQSICHQSARFLHGNLERNFRRSSLRQIGLAKQFERMNLWWGSRLQNPRQYYSEHVFFKPVNGREPNRYSTHVPYAWRTCIHTYIHLLKIRVAKNIYKIGEQTPIMYMSSILTEFFQVGISVGGTFFFLSLWMVKFKWSFDGLSLRETSTWS